MLKIKMNLPLVALLAIINISSALAVDYKFSHDPISLESVLSDRINSPELLTQEQFTDGNLDGHRELADLYQIADLAQQYGENSAIFEKMSFPQDQYARFQGLDDTSLFATSVSISNDFAIVGSNGYNIYQGIVHVYTPINSSAWAVHSTILSPDGPNINFGLSVDHTSKFLIVGANAIDAYKGAAYIYQYMNGKYWILTTRIYSPFGATQGFGFKVAIDGHTAVVSTAINDVCVYEYSPATESWRNTLKLSGTGANDRFGNSIGVYGNYIIIGAPQASNGFGVVYVYKKNSTDAWNKDHLLLNPSTQSQFGYSVAIFNTTVAIGAVGFREGTYKPVSADSEINTGYAYLYDYDAGMTNFVRVQDIPSPVGRKSYFGVFVKLANDKLIVGADGTPVGNNTGAAFLYFRKPDAPRSAPNAWLLNYSLPSPAGNQGYFGYAVDVCDDYAVSGAFGFDDLRGAVYLVGFPKFQPTFAPTFAPNADSGALSFETITSAAEKQQKMMEILAIGVLALVSTLTSACCIYLCCVPVAPKKKKKEEEEESPYTVHSYVGYSEMDEYMPPQAPPPQWMPFFPQMPMMPMMMMPPPPPVMPMMPMEKKKTMDESEVDLKKTDENFVRKLFPYKVYGPRGYEEEQTTRDTLEREKRESDKSSSSEGSIGSEEDSNSYSSASRQQTIRPFSMDTIRESEHENDSYSSSSSDREAVKNALHQRPGAIPYTYSSQYTMQGYQQYNMSGYNDPRFFAPPQQSGDELSSLSSQPSQNLYGAATHNPMFAPSQAPFAHPPQPGTMMAPPSQQTLQQAPQPPRAAHRATADYSSDSSSQLKAANYVSMAKQSYAKFKQQTLTTSRQSNDDDSNNASVSSDGSSVAASRPAPIPHGEQVRMYATERSSSDLASTTSSSDDSFVKRAKERYMNFLMKKNMTREEHDADDTTRDQSNVYLRANRPQEEEEDGDNATVSTMTGTVRSGATGFYSESSTGSSLSQHSSNSAANAGVLNLRPASARVSPPVSVAEEAAPAVIAPPAPPVAQAAPVRNTLFKSATVDRVAVALDEAPSLRMTRQIEIEELNEIKEFAPPVRQNTALLTKKSVANLSSIEERELNEIKPMASITRPQLNTSISASTAALAVALEQEVEDARQKTVEELERARSLAQSMAAEEELKRVQERNRMKEETRLRAEERARAQFARHKQLQQQQSVRTTRTTVASSASETLLAAERALASVQQVTSSSTMVAPQVTRVVSSTVVNNTVSQVTTTTNNVMTTSTTTTSARTLTQPRIEEP